MPVIPDYDSLRSLLEETKMNTKSNEKTFWYELLRYWENLLLNGKIDEMRSSVCNWKYQFDKHFSDETTVVKDINKLIFNFLEGVYP